MFLCSSRDSVPDFLDFFEIQFAGNAQNHIEGTWAGKFRIEFSCHCSDAFVAKVLEREVGEVEIRALKETAALERCHSALVLCFEICALERLVAATFKEFFDSLYSAEACESFFCHFELFFYVTMTINT